MAGDERFSLIFDATDNASGTIEGLVGSLGRIHPALLGVVAAAGGAAAVFTNMVQAVAESEKAWRKLQSSIEQSGGTWDTARARVSSFADTMLSQFGIADEAVAEAISRFVDYGASVEKSMQLFSGAVDLAAGRTIPLSDAVDALARAYAGNTMQLSRLVVGIDEAGEKVRDFDTLYATMLDRFGGRGAAEMETAIGSWGRLKAASSELFEEVSKHVVGDGSTMSRFLDGLTKIVIQMKDATKTAEELEAAWESAFDATHTDAEGGTPFGPPTPTSYQQAVIDATKAMVEQEKEKAKAHAKYLEQLEREWDIKREALYYEAEVRRGYGEQFGPETPDQFAQNNLRDLAGRVGEGPMSMLWEREEDERKAMNDRMLEEQREFAAAFAGVTTSGIEDMLMGFARGRVRLAKIFEGMFQDFYRLFIQQMLRRIGAKIAGAILGTALGGPIGGIAGGASGEAVGTIDFTGSLGKTGGGISPTGASAAQQIIIVNMGAPSGMTQDFVRNHLLPEIDRQVTVGASATGSRR